MASGTTQVMNAQANTPGMAIKSGVQFPAAA